ncbi:MAG: hypothetical protein ACYC3O_09925 [Burkholderiales bacterium]
MTEFYAAYSGSTSIKDGMDNLAQMGDCRAQRRFSIMHFVGFIDFEQVPVKKTDGFYV